MLAVKTDANTEVPCFKCTIAKEKLALNVVRINRSARETIDILSGLTSGEEI